MPTRLYIVHGSHPCDTVAKALELKRIPYKTVEIPPPTHALFMRRLFGGMTVPAIRFEDGERVQGSRAILRELDRRVPDPPLAGGPEVAEAERWGDETLQPIARRLLWDAFSRDARAMHGFQQGQRNPKLPMPVVRAAGPLITRMERRMNDVTEPAVRADLQALPAHLDRIDAWIADGVLGGPQPNAADLQIATSVRLLHAVGDVRPLIAGRPAEQHAFTWFERLPGGTEPGLLPADWIPAAT